MLNKAIGCWEDGYLIPDGALYPEDWIRWGNDPRIERCKVRSKFLNDKVSLYYFLLVLMMTVVSIVGIWLS